MNDRMVAIIPARGGSKRLPRKNIYPLFGRPLLQWVVEAAKQSKYISDVYVSTEDAEIKAVARRLGAKVIDRPAALAGDTVWTQEVLKHAVTELDKRGAMSDILVRLQANSPQVQAAKIDEAIEKLKKYDRWEVFSVNEAGVEDAAIHVMRKSVVFQPAFSVYKAVVTTDYIDVHTKQDVARLEAQRIATIEARSLEFLRRRQAAGLRRSWRGWVPGWLAERALSLWGWQTKVSLARRWRLIVEQSPPLRAFLESPSSAARAGKMAVLDLGCGFGMYWPILREYGFRRFVGIDLFDKRGRQSYLAGAKEYVAKFCPDCETQLIMDDVRNLAKHRLLYPKFAVILNIATTSTKGKSTGIPSPLFQRIVKEYGTENCIGVHVEKAH